MQILSIFKTYGKSATFIDKRKVQKMIKQAIIQNAKFNSITSANNLECILNEFCNKNNKDDISKINLPLAIPTVDLSSGNVVYFLSKPIINRKYTSSYNKNSSYINDYTNIDKKYDYIKETKPSYNNLNSKNIMYHGKISSIIRASCSVPCVFNPKYMFGTYFVDGGIKENSPVNILRDMGATKVLAISFETDRTNFNNNLDIISIGMRSVSIMGDEISKKELKNADLSLVLPIANISLLDYTKIGMCANIGYEYTKKNIDRIRKLIEE